MIAVAAGRRPLTVASAVTLLEASPRRALGDGIRESGGLFAQLRVKLSLFGTLLGEAPARGTWGWGQRTGARLIQPGPFARQG